MANTYTQLYIQFVFSVKYRESLIEEANRVDIQKYMTGIVQELGHKMLAIYCMPDHCHIFMGYNPIQSLSDCMRIVKANSSKWINEQGLSKTTFRWQNGFGAFSYSNSHVDNVIQYILNQPERHRRKNFRKEYLEFLNRYELDYEEKYLFDWLD